MPEIHEFPSPKSFDLPKRGERYVREARQNVSKIVRATPGVSCPRYPSPKTGFVIVSDSRTGEFTSDLDLEWDEMVTEYWDQPGKIKLIYASKNGRKVAPQTTPDRLYHHRERGWVIREVKHRAKIEAEALNSPNRYCRDSEGRWICPPGIDAAKAYGMQYEVFVPDLGDEVSFRNGMWLEDYFLEENPPDESEHVERLRELLVENGGCRRLSELIAEFDDVAPVYRALAHKKIYFDRHRDLICRPERMWVYTDEATAIAWQHVHGIQPVTAAGVDLLESAQLQWDNERWIIAKVTDGGYTLQSADKQIVTLSTVQISQLIDTGDIRQLPTNEPGRAALALLQKASPRDFEVGNYRMELLRRFSERDHTATQEVSPRTLSRWKKSFRQAEHAYGCGYLGLLPKHRRKGNKSSRVSKQCQSLLDRSLSEDYLSDESMTLYQAYALFTARCRKVDIDPVTYETYRRRARARDVVTRVKGRYGKKAAYQRSGPLTRSTIPVEGDRPWEVAHLDHTRLDHKLKSAVTAELLGNPWMTLLMDAKTHEPLARYLSLNKPSKVAIMMALRDCVYRHNRLPQRIVVDQGAEFNSVYVDTLFASQWVTKLSRPASEPRFGAMGERMNGIINTKFLRLLKGNSRPLKDPRSMSKTHDPRENALWTPDAFMEAFDRFLFKEYPALRQKETHETPHGRYDRLMATAGYRPSRYIPFDEQFLIMTMLEPDQGRRMVHSYGVSINSLRYWSAELNAYVQNKKKYCVKIDPMNLNHAYIFIEGKWIELTCTSPIVAEYNELGLDQGHIELIARATVTNREYRAMPESYARFVLECKRNEAFLAANQSLVQTEAEDPPTPSAGDEPQLIVSDDGSFEAASLAAGG